MSETPGDPEYYHPPADSAPPSISDAAAQLDRDQTDGAMGSQSAPRYAPQPAPMRPVAYGQPTLPGQPYARAAATGAQGFAVTALVLGIVAFVTGCVPVWGLIVGVLAVVFGSAAIKRNQPRGMAVAGIVAGIIGAVVSTVWLVIYITSSTVSPDSIDTSFNFSQSAPHVTLGPDSVDGGLAVSEQAFAPMSYDDSVTWFVVILKNPSDNAYRYTDVTVNALDASGNVIDTSHSYPAVPGGESALAGTFYALGGKQVASLEVVGPSTEGLTNDPSADLIVTDVEALSDGALTTVTGQLTSSGADAKYGAAVTVVARDASGTIVDSGRGYVDGLSQGESEPFDVLFFDVAPNSVTYEAYVTAY